MILFKHGIQNKNKQQINNKNASFGYTLCVTKTTILPPRGVGGGETYSSFAIRGLVVRKGTARRRGIKLFYNQTENQWPGEMPSFSNGPTTMINY